MNFSSSQLSRYAFLIRLTIGSILLTCIYSTPSWASYQIYPPIDRKCPKEQLDKYISVLNNTKDLRTIGRSNVERSFAIKALSFCGAKAVPTLQDILRNKTTNEYNIFNALNALWNIGPEASSSIPEVINLLDREIDGNGHDYIIAHSLRALRNISRNSNLTLKDLLEQNKNHVKIKSDLLKKIRISRDISVIEELGKFGDENLASSILLPLIEKYKTGTSERASLAIANIGLTDSTFSSIINLLHAHNPCVIKNAALVLGIAGRNNENTVPYLKDVLINSDNALVKNAAALSIINFELSSKKGDTLNFIDKDIILEIASIYSRKSSLEKTSCVQGDELFDVSFGEILNALSTVASSKCIPTLVSILPDLIEIAGDENYNYIEVINLIGTMGAQAKTSKTELVELFYRPFNLKNQEIEMLDINMFKHNLKLHYKRKIAIAKVLGKIGEMDIAIPYLINILKSNIFYTQNPDSIKRWYEFEADEAGAASQALGDIGISVLPYLISEIDGLNPLQKRAAVYVLYDLSRKHTLPQVAFNTLAKILEDKHIDINTRRIAAYALENSGENVNWFFSEMGLLPLKNVTCLPDTVYTTQYQEYYDIFTGKCYPDPKGGGGPDLYSRIRMILFPRSNR